VPSVGESITEVEIGDWLKNPGDSVRQDEPIVVIETEKVTVELPAPASGTLTIMLKHKGEKASVGDVIGYMEPNGTGARPESETKPTASAPAEGPVDEAQAQQRAAENDDRPGGPRSASATARSLSDRPPLQEQTPAGREEQIVPMTPIRRRIAERLVEAQKSAALLTTFNQVDMSSVMALRRQYQGAFQARYNAKL